MMEKISDRFSKIIKALRREEPVEQPPEEVIQIRLKGGWRDTDTTVFHEGRTYRKLIIYPDGRVDIQNAP